MKSTLFEQYLGGAARLAAAIQGMSEEQLKAHPLPGKWSTLELLCHVADMEGVYTDRMKRVLAEEEPPLPAADENAWARNLRYHDRSAEAEIAMIAAVRRQMEPVLRGASPDQWTRVGIHSNAGPLTLEQLFTKVISHLEHHLRFIEPKRSALGLR